MAAARRCTRPQRSTGCTYAPWPPSDPAPSDPFVTVSLCGGVQVESIEKLHVEQTKTLYEVHLKQMRKRETLRRKKGMEALDPDGVDAPPALPLPPQPHARVVRRPCHPTQVELAWVFHACAAEAVDNIIVGSFNRSYAGKNATLYGPGYRRRTRLTPALRRIASLV